MRWAIFVLVAVAWVPMMILAAVEHYATGRVSPVVADYSVHTRLLVSIPFFFVAERSMHIRTVRCIDRFVVGQWAEGGGAAVSAVTAQAARWRDAVAAELVILALAALGSQAILWGFAERLGLTVGRHVESLSASVAWYGMVGLPIFQFLLGRWLWRWIIWSRLLWGLSRLRLRPLATHPDLQGGLGFLSEPVPAFAFVLFAFSAVVASVWADQVKFAGAEVTSFTGELGVAVALALLVALGPLLVFVLPLMRKQFEAVRQYDELATDYARQFHARWIDGAERRDLLGAADIQSLADMGNAYQVVRRTRTVPIDLRTIIIVAVAVLLPMLPLALMQIPIAELVRRLGKVAAGGLPG